MLAWDALGGLDAYRITEIPRRPEPGPAPAQAESDDPGRIRRPAPSLEECLLAAWPGPFGWLLIAEPLSAAEIGKLAEELARREQYATGDSDRFPGRATAARRLSLRHGEMRKGVSSGMWRIWLLAGGADTEAAARVAGLVCASADLSGLPYAITPTGHAARGLREALEDPDAAEPPAGGDAVA